jgi:hypothetical protein
MSLQNYGGTFLSNMITRPEFLGYTSERIFEQSKFIQAGIVQRNSALDASAGGTRVRVPFFDTLNPTEEQIKSSNDWGTSGAGYLTSQNITTDEQIMTILHRGFQFATDDLSRLGSGADALGHVRDQLAGAINKLKTATLMAQLSGLFGNISGSGVLGANTVNVSGTTTATSSNYLTAASVVRAKNKLGERGSELGAIAMHSNVAAYLEETGFLQVQVSGSTVLSGSGINGSAPVATFAGLRVIVDDQLSVISGGTSTHLNKYPVYLFGNGVVAEGMQQDLRLETDRNKSSFQDLLIVDYHYGYHVMGTKWSAAGDNPTNASSSGNLAATGSWTLAYGNAKNVPLVRLLVNTPYDTGTYA